MEHQAKRALILGAGRGVGRETAKSLAAAGWDVTAVARTAGDLESLAAEQSGIRAEPHDIAEAGALAELVQASDPDFIAQIGGMRPTMAPISAFDWEGFSAVWESDTRATFELVRALLRQNSTHTRHILTFASGAALNGSPLSGGYAGAKRMQHYLMNYAQMEANQRKLPLTFATVYPKQLIAGTDIAKDAATAYGEMRGGDGASFMAQWERQITASSIAAEVLALASSPRPGVWGIDGAGLSEIG